MTTSVSAEDERDALEWLKVWADATRGDQRANHARTILALLDRPTLPAAPTPEMLCVMRVECEADMAPHYTAAACYRALYDYVTRPKTKTVEVWHVEYSLKAGSSKWAPALAGPFLTQAEAEDAVESMAREPHAFSCIRVTGPRQQEVPCD